MKWIFAALALLLAGPTLAQTPICFSQTDGSCARVQVDGANGFAVTLDHPGKRFTCGLAGLAASLTECQALAAGRTYYITDIVVGTTTATSGTYGIQVGTGTNCGSNTATIFPAPPATTASRYQAPIASNPVATISFTTPLVTPVGYAICVIGVATNTINIQVSGYYSP